MVCHLVNLCVKSAVKALPIVVDEILVDMYHHFPHSVKSIASLKDCADFVKLNLLKHCETRWLSLRHTIKHAESLCYRTLEAVPR